MHRCMYTYLVHREESNRIIREFLIGEHNIHQITFGLKSDEYIFPLYLSGKTVKSFLLGKKSMISCGSINIQHVVQLLYNFS
jgi:hypothetical protein